MCLDYEVDIFILIDALDAIKITFLSINQIFIIIIAFDHDTVKNDS